MSKVLLALIGRAREKYVCSIFLEVDVSSPGSCDIWPLLSPWLLLRARKVGKCSLHSVWPWVQVKLLTFPCAGRDDGCWGPPAVSATGDRAEAAGQGELSAPSTPRLWWSDGHLAQTWARRLSFVLSFSLAQGFSVLAQLLPWAFVLCCGAILCTVGCLAASLVSSH